MNNPAKRQERTLRLYSLPARPIQQATNDTTDTPLPDTTR